MIVFGVTFVTSPVALGSLAQYAKPIINNLGIKVDANIKFDSQVKAVVKASFIYLRPQTKVKPFQHRQHFFI